MKRSQNFNFFLPSRDTDDIVDVNQLSDNFRTIDDKTVEKVAGKGLSSNDFTNEEKEKLESTVGKKYGTNNGEIFNSYANNVASGEYSHAEGLNTTASGAASHAQNNNTIAAYASQTAMGLYNNNKQDTLLEVGNGNADATSNAFEVYRDGHAEVQITGTTDTSLTTKKHVDDAIAAALSVEGCVSAANVSYDNSVSGLDSTNVKNALDEIVVKFGNVVKVENWADVQKVVRNGLASKVFKIGEQLECKNKSGGKLVWDIIGFDHDAPVDSNYQHSMTIQLHDCYTSAVFDAREALLYAENELAAGTYNFEVVTQPWYTADNGKTFQFTLANALPAGSQVVLDVTYNQTLDGKKVKVYSGATSTTVVEEAVISIGNGGTALGKTNGTVDNLNHIQRAIMGYNRWTQSGLRQWLNSDAAASSWWTPQNIFDRPPSNSTSAGFLSVVDDELRAVIGNVTKRSALNIVVDGGGYEDSEELMFLLSRSELYGGLENNINEGEPYPYYANYSDLSAPGTAADSNRIKYRNGSAQYQWTRSCYSGYAGIARGVLPTGLISDRSAYDSYGVAPACNII